MKKTLVGVLAILAAFALVDPVYPVALIFWKTTVPLSDLIVAALAGRFGLNAMLVAVVAVWASASITATCWLLAAWVVIRPRRHTAAPLLP